MPARHVVPITPSLPMHLARYLVTSKTNKPTSILRTLFQVPYPVSPVFATLTKTPGAWAYSSHSGMLRGFSTFAHSDLRASRRVSELSPFFSHPCALICTFLQSARTQPLYFQAFPHSTSKKQNCRGGGTFIMLTRSNP